MARVPENNEIEIQQSDALRHQASRFTYCLIDRTDEKIGTAIAVNLDQRFFFVTAKHMIDSNHELEILAKGPQASTSSNFIAKCCDEQLDVGHLELNPNEAYRFEFAEGTRLMDAIDAEQELPRALVIGYPGQFINSTEIPITRDSMLRINRCDSLIFWSIVLPQSEWPSDISLNVPLDPGRDLLVDFNPESQVRHLPPGTSLDEAFTFDCPDLNPEGMSGGGIWLAYEERTGRLHLPNIKLIGIQTSWLTDRCLLRGLRIGVWLNMVQSRLAGRR